jgi:hypothetical protein
MTFHKRSIPLRRESRWAERLTPLEPPASRVPEGDADDLCSRHRSDG